MGSPPRDFFGLYMQQYFLKESRKPLYHQCAADADFSVRVQVSSKVGLIESLMESVDKIILGGSMVFTFLKAWGLGVGSSLVEDDQLDMAKQLEEAAKRKGCPPPLHWPAPSKSRLSLMAVGLHLHRCGVHPAHGRGHR